MLAYKVVRSLTTRVEALCLNIRLCYVFTWEKWMTISLCWVCWAGTQKRSQAASIINVGCCFHISSNKTFLETISSILLLAVQSWNRQHHGHPGWRTLCFREHFTQKEHFALLHLAQKNSLLQIGLLQFAL